MPATASAGLNSVADNDWVTNGPVFALARSGNTLYLGGEFSEIGPRTGPVAAFSGGSSTPEAGFPQVAGGHAEIRAAIPDGSGGWYLGGNFTHVGDVARAGLAHVLADGSIDPSFAPGGLEINQNTWSVDALALSGSTLYVGGSFNNISGTPRRGLAAVTTTDGAMEPWNPAPGSGLVSIEALTVSGGVLYVGGQFSQLEGQARSNLGAFDATSQSLTSWAPQATGTNPTVKALAVSGSTVYLAGSFDHVGGQARSGFGAVDTSGNLSAWNPQATAPGQAFGDALAAGASTVYLCGGFNAVGGQPRNAVAAVDPVTAAPTSWNAEANAGGIAKALAVSGSTLYVAGTFTRIGGQARNGLAGLDATTAAATSWNPDPNATAFPNGFPFADEVDTVVAAGTQVVAGGSFTSVGGVARNDLAAVDLSTGKATAWNPNVTPTFTLFNAPISTMSATGGAIYVGGSFSSVGGQARTDLAALDPTTGAATSWNPGATSTFPENGHVTALLASGSGVYVGGSFTALAGSAVNYLGAISASTGTATSWSPVVTAPSSATEHGASPIAALALSGSTLYVGGDFTGLGGQIRTGLGALSAETGSPTAWNTMLSSVSGAPDVTSLAPAGGVVYANDQVGPVAIDAATGAVTTLNYSGAPVAVGPASALYLDVIAIDLSSGLQLQWSPVPGGFGGAVTVLAAGDRVILGGAFNTTDQTGASGFAVYGFTGPVNSAAPTISGVAAEEQTLTEHHGSWSGAPTSFSYQWLRCVHAAPYPPPCTPIVGATASTYVPTSADARKTIEVQETATNAEGASDPVGSAATAAVLARPASLSPPTVSGTPVVGQTLSCSTGSWSNSPTSYAYQWLRDSEAIPGASTSSYTPVPGDVGHELACEVTATNAGGSGKASAVAASIEGEPSHAAKEPPAGPSGGGTVSGGGVLPPLPVIDVLPPATGPSPATVAAALKAALGAAGTRASASELLATGSYRVGFNAPGAGLLSVRWMAAIGHGHVAVRPVVIASGTRSFAVPGHGTLTLRLSALGRKLLRKARALRVIEIATFKPSVGSAQTKHTTLILEKRSPR